MDNTKQASTSKPLFENIPPSVANSRIDEFLLLDVRAPSEFEHSHIQKSIPYPLSRFNVNEVSKMEGIQKGCLLICASGTRARQAAEKLTDNRIGPVFVLEGGLKAWESEGLPLIRGRKTVSLERQVRITAGALVFTGVTLGYFVNPLWLALSGFVGAGLIFSGITDTCGMGLILAQMPWNTRGKC
jgi:rhodanese-related sulfurtransferase